MRRSTRSSRRQFLAGAAALAIPSIVPRTVLGGGGRAAPSERIGIGAIGFGGRCRRVLGHFLEQRDVECLAVADCFADRRQAGKKMVDEKQGNRDCRAHRFHEDLLGRDDIDAVIIATGDRWHAVLSVLAARAGKDVYCEKPFCLTVAEGRTMVEATKKHAAIWQCGTQRRSNDSYRFVVDSVRGGKIGKLHTITTFLGGGFTSNGIEKPVPRPAPDVFDYDRWTGQAPLARYSEIRVKLWRQRWSTGGGLICDMGPHYFDTAQWAHDSEMDAPREFEGTATWPPADRFAETPFDFNVVARYRDGVRLIIQKGDKGVRFEGDGGWIHITDAGVVTAEPRSILSGQKTASQSWTFMDGHIRNFLDCMRSRKLTVSHPELAHRNHTICHCANVCLRLGRKVEWDPARERFVGDAGADALLSRPMRAPWRI